MNDFSSSNTKLECPCDKASRIACEQSDKVLLAAKTAQQKELEGTFIEATLLTVLLRALDAAEHELAIGKLIANTLKDGAR